MSRLVAPKTWDEALNYCENLRIEDYDDWRLPNIKELQSIIDYNTFPLAIEISFFSNIFSFNRYWSSTTHISPYHENHVWIVEFISGLVNPNMKFDSYDVHCVRGGSDDFLNI